MTALPKHLYWAIENDSERQVEALYWKKVRSIAQMFSLPITMLNAQQQPLSLSSFFLSKEKLTQLNELKNQQDIKALNQLIALFEKKHLKAGYQSVAQKPFFEGVLNTVKQTTESWVMAQSSESLGIPNIIWQLVRHCPNPVYIAKQKDWHLPLNILAAVDPTHENDKTAELDHKILQTASNFQKLSQANVHIVHCHSSIIMTSQHSIQQQLEALHQESFDNLLSDYNVSKTNQHFLAGDPAKQIKRLCQKHDIDLVIMGGVSRNSVERLFIGSTVEEVLPSIKADLLLVKT